MAVDGTYNINLETPMGNRPGKLTLRTDGGSLGGTFAAEGAESTFAGGTVSGVEIAFSVQVSTPMGQITLNFKGTVSGDAISGQVQAGEFGSFPFNGTQA